VVNKQQADTIARLKQTVKTQQGIILDVFRELRALGEAIESATGNPGGTLEPDDSGAPEIVIATSRLPVLTRALSSTVTDLLVGLYRCVFGFPGNVPCLGLSMSRPLNV
jgi:hypothetical protein